MKLKVPLVVQTFRVPSRTTKNTHYLVKLYSDGQLECDCIAGGMGRKCWHQGVVREKMAYDKGL